MKISSPLVQMTVALVALTGTLLMLADLFFGVLSSRDIETMRARKQIGESLAVQVAALMERDERELLQRTLASVLERNAEIRSLAIRRADGQVVLQFGNHQEAWHEPAGERSTINQVAVPLHAGTGRWGQFEVAFRGPTGNALVRWLSEPMVLMLLFISTVGAVAFALYLRRALQHLDPASVIPDRVQGAFDTMNEGVVVLDTRGRVLLTNKAFRALHDDASAALTGTSLSALPWLAPSLPADPSDHPWARAMNERTAINGLTLDVGAADRARHLVVNCAPIADPGGAARGCLATFNDVTELHRANAQLRDTLEQLSSSKAMIELKNQELHRMATRDALSGCLNRRAFHEQLAPLFARSQKEAFPLSCLMIDIDHFKAVNDTHGHATGDRVIQEVAKQIAAAANDDDLVCRYGGEEFCVVAPNLGVEETRALAEQIRQRIERDANAALRDLPQLKVTVSIGVHTRGAGAASVAELIDRADQALYRSKRTGRNRVSMFAGPQAASLVL
ncbi:MAG TPA: GGDEF domain-containing protein [Burkholderiaceae bacterium]|nr:GGDEF domain-containing protein [Burkholderiaceae bacterium]